MQFKKGDVVRRKIEEIDDHWRDFCKDNNVNISDPFIVNSIEEGNGIILSGVSIYTFTGYLFELVKESDNPLNLQIGGTHYKEKGIQPIEYINANALNFNRGNIIKYGTGRDSKHGTEEEDIVKGLIQDLEKVKHYADFEIKRLKKYGR